MAWEKKSWFLHEGILGTNRTKPTFKSPRELIRKGKDALHANNRLERNNKKFQAQQHNRTALIRHLSRKTIALSCHRWLINTDCNFHNPLSLSKSCLGYSNSCLEFISCSITKSKYYIKHTNCTGPFHGQTLADRTKP
jgi:hypothetical protein